MHAIEKYVIDQRITSENVCLGRTDDGGTKWKVNLTKDGVTESFRYFQGSAHKEKPATHDVVWCLGQDAQMMEYCRSVEEFASEFGYAEDDIEKAEEAWEKIQENNEKLHILGIDLEELWTASEDY